MNTKHVVAILLAASLTPLPALAQAGAAGQPLARPTRPLTAADLEGLRAEIRSSRKQTVASTLKLSDAEATKFWPVYDKYAAELTGIKNDYYSLIAEYVSNFGKFDDKTAASFIGRWMDVDAKTTALRAKYVPIVNGVLPGMKSATFFQIDRTMQEVIDMKLSSQMPLLQDQPK